MQDGPITAADQAALRKLDATVQEMLAEDLPAQLQAARLAARAGNADAAMAEVHSIRGSAGFCKLERLYEAASQAEEFLRDNGASNSRECLDTLASTVAAVLDSLPINEGTE